jgi:hypothetical protein
MYMRIDQAWQNKATLGIDPGNVLVGQGDVRFAAHLFKAIVLEQDGRSLKGLPSITVD